jgi:hypothetical protein
VDVLKKKKEKEKNRRGKKEKDAREIGICSKTKCLERRKKKIVRWFMPDEMNRGGYSKDKLRERCGGKNCQASIGNSASPCGF